MAQCSDYYCYDTDYSCVAQEFVEVAGAASLCGVGIPVATVSFGFYGAIPAAIACGVAINGSIFDGDTCCDAGYYYYFYC